MKKPLYGVSMAIVGNNPSKMLSTVVGGPEKDQLYQKSAVDTVLLPATRKFHDAIMALADSVNTAVDAHKETDVPFNIPFVFGVGNSVDKFALLHRFSESFPSIVDKNKVFGLQQQHLAGARIRDPDRGDLVSIEEAAFQTLIIGIRDEIIANIEDPSRVDLYPREFGDQADQLVPKEEATVLFEARMRSGLIRDFRAARQNKDRDDLEDLTKDLAFDFANYKKLELTQAQLAARFYLEQCTSDQDVRHLILQDDGLRKVFCERFMAVLGIKHNISMRTNFDTKTPNRPFSSVAAAYAACNMDKRDKTKPTVITVQYEPGQTS